MQAHPSRKRKRPEKRDKDTVLDLPPADVQIYLRDTPNKTLSPPPSTTLIARPIIELVGAKPRNLWFINPSDHPACPKVPGRAGLVFGFEHYVSGFSGLKLDPTQGGFWSVFVRMNTRRGYLYIGEYRNTYVEGMSKEQFCSQKSPAQEAWVLIQHEHLQGRGRGSARARYALRREGFPEQKMTYHVVSRRAALEAKDGRIRVTKAEVQEAFQRGYERVSVMRMQCVGYDRIWFDPVEQAHLVKGEEGKLAKKKRPPKRTKVRTPPEIGRSTADGLPVDISGGGKVPLFQSPSLPSLGIPNGSVPTAKLVRAARPSSPEVLTEQTGATGIAVSSAERGISIPVRSHMARETFPSATLDAIPGAPYIATAPNQPVFPSSSSYQSSSAGSTDGTPTTMELESTGTSLQAGSYSLQELWTNPSKANVQHRIHLERLYEYGNDSSDDSEMDYA
ncbi:hypothetical protein NMY22_g8826 [Coprinellus aureogranulatus]|nr:hypothetical protein NMY22_g8826 [Coprinellus aureogranulatus]